MTSTTDIRREIVNQERRLRTLITLGESQDSEKALEIKALISKLRMNLTELEKKSREIEGGSTIRSIQNLVLDDFAERVQEYSEDMLFTRYVEKFSPEYYYPRVDLNEHFQKFLISDKVAMVLIGKAGTGKSAFICSLVETPPDNTIIWLQDCARINSRNLDVDSLIGKELGIKNGMVEYLNQFLIQYPQKKVIFIFDSVNEFNESTELLQNLSTFINSIEDARIKVVITCRIPIWDSIKRFLTIPFEKGYHVTGPDTFVNVSPFTDSEIKGAFDHYRTVYKIKTDFENLSSQVRNLIKNPLLLKMTAKVYEKAEIPGELALRDIFSEYINKCLGPLGYESEEFKVLNRLIELMYENASRELEIAIIKRDNKIGHFIVPEYNSPFFKLVDEGLLSQRLDKTLLKKIEMIFITYERVFEYLLAEIIIGEVNTEKIIRNLELSLEKPFVQLRGATELAFSFSILNKTIKVGTIIEMARLNRPDSRQFLCDVIQTIYDSGNREIAEKIVFEISEDEKPESKYLAVQAAYQLKLDQRLLSLSLTPGNNKENNDLRELATLYLYERWNLARREGKLEEGYKLLHELQTQINLRNPIRSKHALQALLYVCANMMVHIVDDPKSVYPFLDIFKDLIKKVPGFHIREKGDHVSTELSGTANITIDIVASFIKNITDFPYQFKQFIGDPKTTRAILDVGELTSLESLIDHEPEVVKILTWENSWVRFISSSLITHQIYYNIDLHLPFFLGLIDSSKLQLVHKLWATRALVLGLVARMATYKEFPEEVMEVLYDLLVSLWYEISDETEKPKVIETGKQPDDLLNLWKIILYAILTIEATKQRRAGATVGSTMISELIKIPSFCETNSLVNFIDVLEGIAFQGFVDFSLKTLLSKEFKLHWEKKAFLHGIENISTIRGFYQHEVDAMLQGDASADTVWNEVKSHQTFISPKDIRRISTDLWGMVAIATNITVEKATGLYLLEIALSESVEESIHGLVKVTLEVLSDPERIDIAHVQWGLAHDPKWNRYDKLQISRDVINTRPELHAYYKNLIGKIIDKYGKGVLYGEL
jgi:hypothetical protein